MRYRDFGRTGWKVSEIAFGAWQIGGDWGQVDDRQSVDTLLYAFEQGINFVDTAELYGKGHSETVIGQALREWRGPKIYVATKAQPIRWPDADDETPAMRGRFPAWYLHDCVEQSLKRLGVDRPCPEARATSSIVGRLDFLPDIFMPKLSLCVGGFRGLVFLLSINDGS